MSVGSDVTPFPPDGKVAAYVDWVRETALPFWGTRGFDRFNNRFQEALDINGNVVPGPYRAMVQARQIYVFAEAARLGWYRDGSEIAARAAKMLMRQFFVDRSGKTAVIFSIDQSGAAADARFDAYTHAFIMFALAALYAQSGETIFIAAAERIDAFIASELEDPEHGGLFDDLDSTDLGKRQNPVMHLLEAYLAWEDAAPGRGYLERAARIVALFERKLFAHGFIIEHCAKDWTQLCSGSGIVAHWEPGHHYEWAWLLDRHAKIAAITRSDASETLCSLAGQHGHAPDGLIYDELSSDLTITATNHRLWPHTEAIKAAAAGLVGRGESVAFAESMAERLLSRFLDRPFEGGWTDRIDGAGNALVDRVPASSLYHLMLAASEAATMNSDADR